MKNVISITLFGGDKRYFNGALFNAKLAKEFFNDWEFRVYHEDGLNRDMLKEIEDQGAKLVNVGETSIVPTLWRFHVYDDPEVNYFICRDADDRLNFHDYELVNLWIESGFPFHIIRSHPGHRVEMLAGMWGGKSRYFSDLNLGEEMNKFNYITRGKEEDQTFLRTVLYPKIRDISLVHGYDFYNSPYVHDFPRELFTADGQKTYPIGEVYDYSDERSLFD
jgi:hypothetical protein